MSNLTAAAASATASTIVLTNDDATAAALVATIKSAVNGAGKYAAYVASHGVTRESVKDHARALAVLAYPKDEPIQKRDGVRTRFGNAVQAAGNGLRGALPKSEPKTPDLLASLTAAASRAVGNGHTAEELTAALHAAGLTSIDATALAHALGSDAALAA